MEPSEPKPELESKVKKLKPTPKEKKNLKYSGGISYENWHTGSRAQRFEMRDQDTILLEWVSKVDTPGIPDSHFIAVAEKDWSGLFQTPWISLKTPEGSDHPFGRAKVSFTIVHHDSMMIKIEGKWTDGDDSKAVYPFNSILLRIEDA